MSDAPLKGLKVVELARVLAGPWIGQTLSDLGAEVIKVESPKGDDTRLWGPPFIERDLPGGGTETVSAYFHSTNRGKTSVVCDFAKPDDLDRLRRLIVDADVLIENFKVGGLAKYGLDYATLSATNPTLVYASITGYGQNGPRSSQPGYDFLMQGMSGVMDVTGEPSREPQKIGIAWIDVFTGLYGVIGIQAALAERAKSGAGQHLDLALFDTALGVLANQSANFLIGEKVPKRMGNAHPNIVPYQVFEASDGHLIIACGNEGQFAKLCELLGLPDLPSDPDYGSNAVRVENREALSQMLTAKTSTRTRADLIAALEAHGVPGGPINTVPEALSDPQAVAREMVIRPDGVAGVKTPLKFSRSDLSLEKSAPMLGDGDWAFKS